MIFFRFLFEDYSSIRKYIYCSLYSREMLLTDKGVELFSQHKKHSNNRVYRKLETNVELTKSLPWSLPSRDYIEKGARGCSPAMW